MRFFLSLFFSAASALAAGPVGFSSGANRTHLIELYTSEGCSSCPPAEAWLGGLRAQPGLWRDFVPVEFHVDFWDRLGWPDRFASSAYTKREYAYAAAWDLGSVYTPCFVLDGAEWHGGARPPPAGTETPGTLAVTRAEDGTVHVKFTAGASADYEVYAALLGGGIVSDVKAGENEGRTLRHEFIALTLQSAPLRNGAADFSLPIPDGGGMRHALAVWVTRRGMLAPIQATGGWLDY